MAELNCLAVYSLFSTERFVAEITSPPGTVIGPFDVSFSQQRADAYAFAVGGQESPDYDGGLPPAAIVAAGLTYLIEDLDLFSEKIVSDGGVVHTSQEASFSAPVRPDQKVSATSTMVSNTVRRGSRFLSVRTEFRDAGDRVIGTSSSTIVAPA